MTLLAVKRQQNSCSGSSWQISEWLHCIRRDMLFASTLEILGSRKKTTLCSFKWFYALTLLLELKCTKLAGPRASCPPAACVTTTRIVIVAFNFLIIFYDLSHSLVPIYRSDICYINILTYDTVGYINNFDDYIFLYFFFI